MDKILLVGAAGYFGSKLQEYLIKKGINFEVADINYFEKCIIFKKNREKILNRCASKLNEDYLKEFNIIIGFAGYSNNPIFKKSEKKYHNKEYKYLTRIAKICKKYSINFIFPSSCSVYGASKKKTFLKESEIPNPITHYSKNKIKIEKYLLKISNNNFKPIIMRFATIYGLSRKMRFDLVINMFCGSAITTKKIELNSNGKVNRPFLEISDACSAIYKVLKNKKKIKGQIYNIGSNKDNFQIIDVARMVQKRVKNSKIIFLKSEKKFVSDNLIKNGKDKRNYKINFEKFSKTFNFKTKYKLQNGIKKLVSDLKRLKLNKKKFYSVKFYRLQYLQELYKKNKVDKNLNFIN